MNGDAPTLVPDRTDDDCAQKRGRPRSAAAHQAILSATIELVGEVGINGMSMDELAQRAGVSKATVYRRWSSKETLVLDALRSVMSPLHDVDTGNVRSDLDEYLTDLTSRMAQGRTTNILPHLIEVACHDDALRSSLDDYVQHRRQPLRRILDRARSRGELPPDADIDVMIDALIGPFVYRRLLSRGRIDHDFIERLLDLVVPAAG